MNSKEAFLSSISRFFPNILRVTLMRILGARIGRSAYLGPGSIVAPEVITGIDFMLGSNSRIYKGSKVGNSVRIGSYTELNKVQLGDDCIVGNYCRLANTSIGKNSHIENQVAFTGFRQGSITIGANCYIGIGSILDWSADITIGDYVHIAGPATSFWTHSSVFQALGSRSLSDHSCKIAGSISIGSNSWIGGGTVVYPGVTIGHHSVILPNTVVHRDVDDLCVIGGNPCRLIRKVISDSSTESGFRFESTQ